jgi:hypothetical protein
MSVFNPKKFADPQGLRRVRPTARLDLLRPHKTFFDRHGLRLPPARDADSLDYPALAAIIANPGRDMPAALVDALFYTNAMATPEGMDALVEVADGGQFSLMAEDTEPGDVAVRAWVRDRQAVEMKYAEIRAAKLQTFRYFQGPPVADPLARPPEPTAERLAELEQLLGGVFAKRNRGRNVRVLPSPREHECVFFVRRGEAYRREGALDGSEERGVAFRPVRYDVAGYDYATGTLRVHARPDWAVTLYRQQFGMLLFGALDHFPSEERYTLDPIRAQGQTCLACGDAYPIKRASLVDLHVRRGGGGGPGGGLARYSADDVFAFLAEHRVDLAGRSRLVQATFRLTFAGDPHPRRVTVVPPNDLRYSRQEDARVVERWLTPRGIGKGPLPLPEHADVRPATDPVLALL